MNIFLLIEVFIPTTALNAKEILILGIDFLIQLTSKN
jgi:hypothetical protein